MEQQEAVYRLFDVFDFENEDFQVCANWLDLCLQ